MTPIRILVVDDSAFMRMTLTRRLSAEPDLEVVGSASDGYEAIAQVRSLKPDVVTLDVDMPRMDGLAMLRQLMAEQPTPVIMCSSLTQAGADATVQALTLGAFDFVAKPTQISGTQSLAHELAAKIRVAASSHLGRANRSPDKPHLQGEDKAPLRMLGPQDTILIVGSSTGGPAALRSLFAGLPALPATAILIVQHMPFGFTRSLADRLNQSSAWLVREATSGDRLMCGQALLARGGMHMVVDYRGSLTLNEDPPVNSVRPSVDVTMRSLVEHFGKRVMGLVLTGMGRDGTIGALSIHQAGGLVIAEAESSCVVYGMPRSVVEAGAADYVMPLPEIPALIHRLLAEGQP